MFKILIKVTMTGLILSWTYYVLLTFVRINDLNVLSVIHWMVAAMVTLLPVLIAYLAKSIQRLKRTGRVINLNKLLEPDDIDILLPPGTRLSIIIEFLYSKKVKERVFDGIIADMQAEYFEALDQGRKWKMRWIHARGIMNVLTAVMAGFSFSFVKKMVEIFKVG